MRIPVELVQPQIDKYMALQGVGLEELSDQLGYHRASMRMAMGRGDLSFQMVDRIFCKIGDPLSAWRSPELLPYYWEGQEIPPDMSRPAQCALPECEEWFEIRMIGHGRGRRLSTQKYCSRRCLQNHRNRKAGIQRKGHETHCRHGHAYAEHGKRDARGRKICKVCRGESKKRYEQKPEVRAKKAAWVREWRRRQGEAVAA